MDKSKKKKREKKVTAAAVERPMSPPLMTVNAPPNDQQAAPEERKFSPEAGKTDKKKLLKEPARKSPNEGEGSAHNLEANENESRAESQGKVQVQVVKSKKKKKQKPLSLRSTLTDASEISAGGDGSGLGTTSGDSSTPTGSGGFGSDFAIDNKWTLRHSVDISTSSHRMNLRRYNDMMNHMVIDGDDYSFVYGLRRYHSEPSFTRDIDDRMDLRPGSPLREKCPSMEDLILTQDGYPDLMMEHTIDEEDTRQYDVSAEMMIEWNTLQELEKTRYSFFDELFARGYVVDSMEVPGKEDNIDYLVEADEADFRAKVDYARLVFKTKHVFTGNMVDWYFTGEGRYCWVDGTTYQGEFKNGVMHGDGIILWTDGSIYQGEFIQGIRNGYGIYSTAEGYTYAGDWFQGLPQGKGRMWYDPTVDDSDFYDGEWKACVPHGFGTRQYINGDRYVGNYENGVRSGKGTMIWLEERQVYKGEWVNGNAQGTGTHTWYLSRTSGSDYPTRHVYKGDWFEGTRHGIGRQIYACGSIYEGRWIRGQRHGKGVFVNPAGEVIFGLFRYGSIAGGTDVPLHAPTYSCNFANLVRTIGKTIYITPGTETLQETALHETVTRYLPQIRRLFKRAGYLGESWGNQGHFPKWMEKTVSNEVQNFNSSLDPHIRPHNVHDAETHDTHLHGHKPHRSSPDNVHPLTRFGLWLFMKDCPGVLTDVTLAEFDRAWNGVASISFQTKHNPFEPVYLQQFLQCLIVMAQIIYFDVPKRKERKKARKLASKQSLVDDAPVVSPVDSYTRIVTSQTSLIGEGGEEEEAGEMEEESYHEPPKLEIKPADDVKTETAPALKPKPKPLPFKPFVPKSRLKRELPGAKKPIVGVKGKEAVQKKDEKKGSKAEAVPEKPVAETEAEFPGEGKSDPENEEAHHDQEEEIEGETTEQVEPSPALVKPSVHAMRGLKKFKGKAKEGKAGKAAAEKASKTRQSADADTSDKPRRFSESSTMPDKRKEKRDTDHELKDIKLENKDKDDSEHASHRAKRVESKKSGVRLKGKNDRRTKSVFAKKLKAEEHHPGGTPTSAESEEHAHEDGEEGSETGHFRKQSGDSDPGEQSRETSAESVTVKHLKKSAALSKGSLNSAPGHNKVKGRKVSIEKPGPKRSRQRTNSTGSAKSKSKREHESQEKKSEEESDAEHKHEDENEEEEGEIEGEVEEEAAAVVEEPRHGALKSKFWTSSEVQLNTEERMYGWTGANRAKCKKHLITQAEKVKIVQPGTLDVKISELFERLLSELLLPCLERSPGMHLPEVPDPLPPLADLYFSFSNTYGNKEVINAMDFTQSMLPHLLYPNKNEAIFWTRTKDIKSPQIDLNFVLNYHKNFGELDGEEKALGEDFLGEKLANTNIFSDEIKENLQTQSPIRVHAHDSFQNNPRSSIEIIGTGNTVFGDDAERTSVIGDQIPSVSPSGSDTGLPKVDSFENMEMEFPFAERDLAPEPFLWDRETKCIHVAKREHSFRNLTAEDIMSVLRQLYPQIIGKAAETNMGFELSFCDWLWASAMVAKTSADREYYTSMKFSSRIEHPHRRHHHPNHYGFHPNQMAPASTMPRDVRSMSLFRHQSTLTNLREKYTRSDLHRASNFETTTVSSDMQIPKLS